MLLLLFVILSLAFGYYLWCQRKFYILSWKTGASGLPSLAILWKIKNIDELITTMCELRPKYKSPITFWMGTKCVLYVDDPATLQDVLNAKDCTDKTQLFDDVKDVLGHTILTARYDDWQRYRRLFASCFSHNTLLTFFEIFNNNAKGLTKRFEEVAGKDPIDIRDAVKISFFDNALQTICSRDMAFTEKEHSDLLMAVSSQTELFVLRITHPWLLVQWIYKLTNSYKLQVKCNQIFKLVVNKIMDYKLKQRLEEEEDFQENKSGICLDKALDLGKNGYLTKQEIYDHIVTFITVAFETLSAHIFLTILCLAMYPEYQEKLIEELAANLPADPDAEISYENIKDLKYLDMVYNETLRLMPAIPLTFREVTNDFKLQNGVTLPKGTQILISMFNAHRSKEIWGEKAHEFYPDHFLPENLAKVHPYAFIPFLKGIRICIGYKYAGFISKVFLCRIFRKFRVRTKTKLEDLKYVDNISLQVKNKCLIEVYKI